MRKLTKKLISKENFVTNKILTKHFHFFLLIGLEIFYLLISLIIYRNDIVYSLVKSPREISFWITNNSTAPTQYLELWALIPKYFTIGIFQFYLLQKSVDFFIFLNSSLVVTYSIVNDFLKNNKTNLNSFSLVIFYSILGSLLISFNPLYVNLFFKFGVGYLAIFNFSLYFFFHSFTVEKKSTSISLIIISCFLLLLGYNSYPLLIAYFVLILFFLFLPIAMANKKLHGFFISFIIFISLFIIISSLVLTNISSSYGLFTSSLTEPLFHVLNLVYYTFNTNGEFISLTGMDTFFLPKDYIISEIFIFVLILILTYLSLKFIIRNRNLVLVYLGISLIIIEIFNAYIYNGFTIYNFLIYLIVKNHFVTFNHLGILLTATDFDRLILILFWYVFSVLIVLLLILYNEYTNKFYFSWKKFVAEQAKDGENKTKAKHKHIYNKIRSVFIFFLMIVIVFASIQIFSYSDNFASSESNSISYGVVLKSIETGFNNCLYLQEPTFGSSHIYPYTITPTSENFNYYMNFQNVENSPLFLDVYNSSPANIFIHTNTIYNCEPKSFVYLQKNYLASKNFNETNIITGIPALYTGSENSYDNFLMKDFSSTLNGTVINVNGPQSQNISYTRIPNYISCIGNNDLIELNITLKLISPKSGSGEFSIGMASNDSDHFGFGGTNIFYGIGGISYNNNTDTVNYGLNYINSTSWKEVGPKCIQAGRLNSTMKVKMYLGRENGKYFFFWNTLNKWYVSPPFTNGEQLKYLAFHNYLSCNKYLNYTVKISKIIIKNKSNIIPIFSDSFFGNFTNFINSIKNTNNIVSNSHCSSQLNLAQSALVWNKSASVVEPSAYAIEQPTSGWFQVFNNQPPQGAYYSEGIPTYLLPINSGYGDYRGYAESTLPNSSISIPIKENINGKLSLNLLFSPLGGKLEIRIGNNIEYIDTYSNSSYFKWISFNVSVPLNGIQIVNINGIQSVNLITFAKDSLFNQVCNEIKQLLVNKTQSEGSLANESNSIGTISNFQPAMRSNELNLNLSSNKEFIIILPENVNYGLKIKSLNSNAIIVPVWGNYLGILVNNIFGKNLAITISISNVNLSYIIIFYSMPFSGIFLMIVSRKNNFKLK
jgi:hypothetical protein